MYLPPILTFRLARTLTRRLANAIKECNIQCQEFDEFSQRFTLEERAEWEIMLLEWDKDRAKPDPYVVPNEGGYPHFSSAGCVNIRAIVKSQADVRLELLQLERNDSATTSNTPNSTSATSFLITALDIEDAQYVSQTMQPNPLTTINIRLGTPSEPELPN